MFLISSPPYIPIIMEGALKLKEVTLIHCEALSAGIFKLINNFLGSLKHGPIALIEPNFYSLFLCFKGDKETR
jgi:glucosamine 6-phosphate synthetase-like amidotransferase/phosphosugar isomerase protein